MSNKRHRSVLVDEYPTYPVSDNPIYWTHRQWAFATSDQLYDVLVYAAYYVQRAQHAAHLGDFFAAGECMQQSAQLINNAINTWPEKNVLLFRANRWHADVWVALYDAQLEVIRGE